MTNEELLILPLLKDALTIAAGDSSNISLTPSGQVCFGSTRLGSDLAKDWIEPEAFKSFLYRVHDAVDFLLDGF